MRSLIVAHSVRSFFLHLTKESAWELFRQYRKEDCMGTTQNLSKWEVIRARFPCFMPQRQKSSFGNWWDSSPYPAYRKAILRIHLPTSIGKSQISRLAQWDKVICGKRGKSEIPKKNREESKTRTGKRRAILMSSSQNSLTTLWWRNEVATNDYGRK